MARDTETPIGSSPEIVRSPADVLRLVVALFTLAVLLVVETWFGSTVVGFAHDLLRGVDAIGERFLTAVVVVVRVLTLAFLATGLVLAVVKGRWRLLGTVVLAAAAGVAVFAGADRWIDVQRAALAELSDVAGPLTSGTFPTSTGLTVVAAVVTAAGPWLPRRYRRLGWLLTLGLAGARFVAAPVSGVTVAAVVCGWAGGAVAVVALGAPAFRPTRDGVTAGLRSVGVDVVALEPASVDARGSTPYFGTTSDGRGLFVKVLGRDERKADLLFRLYRFVLPRDLGDERPFSSLRRAVEHEALVALAVDRLGVRTPRVVALCDAEPGGFVLAYEAVSGRSLDRVDAGEITDDVLAHVWEQVGILRRHRVAHRDLRLANLFLDRDGQVWMIDFGFAELAASGPLLATDLAELTAALSLKVGASRAVAPARPVVGGDDLAGALPRLHPHFLSGATRSALKGEPALLDAIRGEVAGSGPPPPVEVRHPVGER